MTGALRRYSQHAYQKTLRLPKTKFASRSSLQRTFDVLIPQSAHEVYQRQYAEFLYKMSQTRDVDAKLDYVNRKLFVLHDGPPYANGDLHFGHALNKILKDIINRFQLLQGKYVFYKPGWDCHGLPIELKALQKLTQSANNISPAKIRSLASAHAIKTIKVQKGQFQQFGIMTNWEDSYITMSKNFEIDQLHVFQQMIQRGLIKRQRKPVYWGTETKTALAEGELEYVDHHKSLSAFVKFPLTEESANKLFESINIDSRDIALKCLIWTSTPWTLFSNRAICFNENLQYSLIRVNHEYLIVECQLIKNLKFDHEPTILTNFCGGKLNGLMYTNPLLQDNLPRPLLHGDHVTSTAGTGLVHTAPGHGADDYLVGVANNLEVYSPVDHEGRYILNELPETLHYALTEPGTKSARKVLSSETTHQILELLREFDMLLYSHEYVHSYPYDWRSKKPIIIRSTPQWFADLSDAKGLALDSLKHVQFYPERGVNRLSSFIKTRNEWCISRQRSWGVPIPAFYKKDNPDEVLMNEETVAHVIKAIKSKGIDSWFTTITEDMKEWLPPSYHNTAHLYRRGKDTVDVWFDSGSSWNVLKDFYTNELGLTDLPKPLADVYLEGSDQHRGWFQSSLLTKVASSGEAVAPYGTIITHGFTLDEKGIKMSKSIGNTISPESIIKGDEKLGLPALGVDGLRLLVAQSDFTTDVVAGPTVMKHVAEALKKFRLTLRFILGNLQESTSYKLLPFDQLRPVDQYTICKLQELNELSKEYYEKYNFSKVLTTIQYHMNNDLSAFYFDIVKDALYADHFESKKRLQIQTTLFHILDTYRSIMAPIIPVMVQEAWNNVPKKWMESDPCPQSICAGESPMTRSWKQLNITESTQVKANFEENHLALLKAYQKSFKDLKDITKSVQTKATLYCNMESLPFSEEEMCDILQVGQFKVVKVLHESTEGINVRLSGNIDAQLMVEPSDMFKCPRCWKHNSTSEDTLCSRCANVITCK